MKVMLHVGALVLCLLILLPTTSVAQSPKDFAVRVTAQVTESPAPSITLKWDTHPDQKTIIIQRKLVNATGFGTDFVASLDSVATVWTDTAVDVGVSYEYRIIRDCIRFLKPDSAIRWWGFGYINSGIRVVPELRNRVLVLVDSTMEGALSAELTQYQADLEAEGWTSTIRYVPRAEDFDPVAVGTVRQLIKDELVAGKRDVQAIFLVGRVPIPYSGVIAPDGHQDHVGAWPADGVYGDDGGFYTDGTANYPNNSRTAQNNVPGDGKFDQSTFSSQLEIPVGRVDFFNLPEFQQSEIELLKAYFNKAHRFRTAQYPVIHSAYIDDNFGSYGEGFATTAWRTFQLWGSDTSVHAADWFESLAGPNVYLWAYGCGGGTDISCGGVCTTKDLAIKPVNAVHTQLFGSYFGDWNTKNNLLRSAIATSPTAITCAWVGRPAWYLQRMALGGTIGGSLLLSQNNMSNVGGQMGAFIPNVIYSGTAAGIASVGERGIHIALMGDPTLRAIMQPVPAMLSAQATMLEQNHIQVSWNAVQGADGYVIARSTDGKKFKLLTSIPVDASPYIDSLMHDGEVTYRVYACALRTTHAGTYYDFGKPAQTSLQVMDVAETPTLAATVRITPQPAMVSASAIITVPHETAMLGLTLVDLSGATVWSAHRSNVAAGSLQIELPAQGLPSGRYALKIETLQGVTTVSYLVVH